MHIFFSFMWHYIQIYTESIENDEAIDAMLSHSNYKEEAEYIKVGIKSSIIVFLVAIIQ